MKKVVANTKGAALVEYGILVALIAVVCIAAVSALGTQINGVFENVESTLSNNM